MKTKICTFSFYTRQKEKSNLITNIIFGLIFGFSFSVGNVFFLPSTSLVAQNLYFPPNDSDTWERLNFDSLGWCRPALDSLLTFLESNNTKAFLIVKDGKIVVESYMNNFSQTDPWYWASAGKTLTAFTVGIAASEGYLNLEDASSQYLGTGWTSLPSDKENNITIWHQLTMTSGLDDGVSDPFCTESNCLIYKEEVGKRWAYHNAPYTLLDGVIEGATGNNLNRYFGEKVRNKIGMRGLFVRNGYNNVYYSDARSMARFGILMLNKGIWKDEIILSDSLYFQAQIRPSQNLNPAYGYLWWLNGQQTYMIPQSQNRFNGFLQPSAPADMYSALGKNGQILNVVPSQNLLVIRLGDAPDNSLVPFTLSEQIWQYLQNVFCNNTPTALPHSNYLPLQVFPNPSQDYLEISLPNKNATYQVEIFSLSTGQIWQSFSSQALTRLSIQTLPQGAYGIRVSEKATGQFFLGRFIRN
ncbi:serine hydrolase [Hugenholtzia roseola]|uniref:serine hydrolase n=1 Tax=Hugenholtzia roseola TaxID=1002 RepID=UPI000409E1CA|nr:serine hydrolase [Hugenholtzia roseola]